MEIKERRERLIKKYESVYLKALLHIHQRWGFSETDVLSRRREAPLVMARKHMAKALYNCDRKMSYPMVGLIMDRHHTTIMHLCGAITQSKDRAMHKAKLKTIRD